MPKFSSIRPILARLTGVGLLSGAGLFLEVTLTRLFSTLFYPPYVFAILSLAVLGIGLGAAAATWRPALRQDKHAADYMALAGLCALVFIIVTPWMATLTFQIPLFVLVILPYFFVGLVLATLFSNAAAVSPQLYLADLVGAGLGTLLVIPALNLLGAINGVLLTAIVLGVAGLVVRPGLSWRLPGLVTAVALIALGSNLGTGWLDLDMAALATEKPITDSLNPGGQVVQTVWDSFARTDLVDPSDGGPYQLFIDGAAGSVMPPAQDNEFLRRDIGFFSFATEQPEQVFVIGPGGGLDVWFGLQSGAEDIVAAEVNPASVFLVEQYAGYNGDLYDQPSVRVVIDEGRSMLRRENSDYDLIFLSQVVTLAAERSGYSLVENTTYTVEAFQEYLAHLRPDGQIAIKLYDEPTLTRALSTALAVFRQQGLSDAAALNHIIALLDPSSQPPIPLLIVSKSPFTREDSLTLGAVARQVGFVPLFLPEAWAEPPLDAVQAGELSFSQIVARSESDISPTTDDRPFFYQFERGVPTALRPLLWVLAALTLLGSVLLIIRQRRITSPLLRWSPLYFAALGVGFITVEIALIQQTRLFLGHPTLAVTTVLATLLIGGGIGSGLAGRRFGPVPQGLPAWPAAAVALLGLAWIPTWPVLNQQFLSADPVVRVTVVILSILPLALLMGMPFPLGLQAVGGRGESQFSNQQVAKGWAVNGVMTVVGSAGTVTIAILAGFTAVLLVGIVAYMVAAVLVAVLTNTRGT